MRGRLTRWRSGVRVPTSLPLLTSLTRHNPWFQFAETSSTSPGLHDLSKKSEEQDYLVHAVSVCTPHRGIALSRIMVIWTEGAEWTDYRRGRSFNGGPSERHAKPCCQSHWSSAAKQQQLWAGPRTGRA